jgi:hypothetical protein
MSYPGDGVKRLDLAPARKSFTPARFLRRLLQDTDLAQDLGACFLPLLLGCSLCFLGGWTSEGAWQAWVTGIRHSYIARVVPALSDSQQAKVLAQKEESFTAVLAGKCRPRVV